MNSADNKAEEALRRHPLQPKKLEPSISTFKYTTTNFFPAKDYSAGLRHHHLGESSREKKTQQR